MIENRGEKKGKGGLSKMKEEKKRGKFSWQSGPRQRKKNFLAGIYYLSISLSACRRPGCHGFKVDWHSCQ